MRLIAFLLSSITALLGAASLFGAFVYIAASSGRSHEETAILVLSGLGLALLVPGIIGLRVCIRGFRPPVGQEIEPQPSWLLQQYGAGKRDFSRIHLPAGDLSGACLSRANLCEANLDGTDLSGADLSRADLRGTMLDNRTQIEPKWRPAWSIVNEGGADRNLRGANLTGANLNGGALTAANLRGANLSGADLSGADLSGAFLGCADLTDAIVSEAQLSQAASLKGAFMPDGSRHR